MGAGNCVLRFRHQRASLEFLGAMAGPDQLVGQRWLHRQGVGNEHRRLKPTVLAQPPAAQVVPDSYPFAIFIRPVVIGDLPLTYQWQRSGTNLAEGYPFYNTTTPALQISGPTVAENGNYRLAISNSWGMVTSAVCTVTVTNSPPYIWPGNPQDVEIALGDSYSISAYVYGTTPFHYQWLKNGQPENMFTRNYYGFWQAVAGDSAGYCLVVTNAFGSVTSRVAQVTVSTDLPVITEQPQPEATSALPGDYAELDAQARGPQELYYSWRRLGEATDYSSWSYMYFDSATVTNTGLYYVIVSNLNGSVTSRVSVLAVAPADPLGVAIDAADLSISNDLYNPWAPDVSGTNDHDGLCAARSASIGDWGSSSFAATVTGPTNVAFWWRIDAGAHAYLDVLVDGVVSSTISGQTGWQEQLIWVPDGTHTLTWTFRKEDAGYVGADAAWVDQLVESGSGPPPSGLTFTTGGDASWFLENTNVHSPPDAWQSGSFNFTGPTWLQTTVTGPGTLSYWCSISCDENNWMEIAVDGDYSDEVDAPLTPWVNKTAPIDSGTHVITWTSYKNSTVSFGADAGWVDDVVFTPSGGTGTAPTIDIQPTNVTVKLGDPAEFEVSASGPGTLYYHWYADDVAVDGATSSTLSIPSTGDGDEATYYVVVSNAWGSVQSSNAVLTLLRAPTINWGPSYDSETVGQTGYFSVSVSGTEPLYYQWYTSRIRCGAPCPTRRTTLSKFPA